MGKTIGVIAVLVALALILGAGALYIAVKNNDSLVEDIDDIELLSGNAGETGPAGNVGPKGEQGEKGDIGETGEDGADGADGSHGAVGPQGPKGDPGTNLMDTPPVMTEHTMDGLVGICDDWTFSVMLYEPDNGQMKVEFYLYVNTSWLDCIELPICWDYSIADLVGDHVWLPFYNEVGRNGVFSFDANHIRDVLSYYLVDGAPCEDFMWRVDVQDCGCFWSETFTFTPTCDGYDGCGDCCPLCDGEYCQPCDVC